MGSTRSPTASLDLPYTHTTKHRSTYRNSPEDHDTAQHEHELSSRSKKKKKKSKKERHGHHHPYHYDDDGHHENHDDEESFTSPPPPTIKLPPIKISLRLPANPAIIPQSSTSSKYSYNGNSSNGNSGNGVPKKKRRSSEHVSVVSDEDESQQPEYSYEGQHESHRKKKKHKHKHKHSHPHHEDQDRGTYEEHGREPHHHQQQYHENHDEDENSAEETARETAAGRITLKLGAKEWKKSEKKSSSHRSRHSDSLPEVQHSPEARSRSRSTSQNVHSMPIEIKQEEPGKQSYYVDPDNDAHIQIGQKRPFSSLQSRRSQSVITDVADEAEEEVADDPLAGDLDELEDGDEAEDDEDEDQQDVEGYLTEDDGLLSATSETGTRRLFGSESVKDMQTSSKTVPSVSSESKNAEKTDAVKDPAAREGSVSAPTKGGRKGKSSKRPLTPKPYTPAAPKKKELSVICHKLLDNFIRKDSYVLFTQPVDIVAVPDYPTVIKNPMDFSTMRAKVERNFYPDIDEFLKDFQLVCDNARLYNSKETLYWKQADKLWEWGYKAIERERKSVLEKEEEILRNVKDEETLDIGGMGDYNNSNNTSSTHGFVPRAPLNSTDGNVDSPMSMADSGRAHTPQQYRKSKKIKQRRDGTIALSYATDGSIDPASHPDPWSLVPVGSDFGAAPRLCVLTDTNTYYNGAYLDEYPYRKPLMPTYRTANYQDYGPYATLKDPAIDASGNSSGVQNIPAYTGIVFGDEKGEAYVQSLAMFMDGIVQQTELDRMSEEDSAGLLEVREYVRKKVETLTRGASTIVDKVAAVVREESTGKPSGVDTRVPKTLWTQEVFVEMSNNEGIAEEIKLKEKKEVETSRQEPLGMKDMEMGDVEKKSEQDANMIKTESPDVTPKLEVKEKSEAAEETSSNVLLEEEMIDIRSIVDEIKAWPAILTKKKDYEMWKVLKIELDSLLPPNQRSVPTSATTSSPADDDIKILWGERWTGGDSEECKKWVREHLENNCEDMRQVVRLLNSKIKNSVVTSASAVASTSATGTNTTVASSSADAVSSSSATTEEEKLLLEQLIKSIRTRLAQMAKYVPLSEINPQRLPPPPLTSVPPRAQLPASSSTAASTSSSASGTALASSPATPSSAGSTPSVVRSDTSQPSQPAVAANSSGISTPAAKVATRVTRSSQRADPVVISPPACSSPGESASSLSSPGSSP
ncbi:hypothetical protein BGX28_002111 [Mortierella sp. GBA30]|nr:hypothetical protein BGX28_002111 [Mortierella sp. GBA30]